MPSRRQLLKGVGGAALALPLAGCSSGEGSTDEETTEETTEESTDQTTDGGDGTDAAAVVAVGPEKRLRYEPEEVEVSVGETVVWEFKSEGHNVTSKPAASPKCENPEGAEPFASYDGDEHFAINEVGTTFSQTFDVAGEYVYVCTPHAGQGMVGTVTVTE